MIGQLSGIYTQVGVDTVTVHSLSYFYETNTLKGGACGGGGQGCRKIECQGQW